MHYDRDFCDKESDDEVYYRPSGRGSSSSSTGRLRSNGTRDRTVEASSPSSTTEADDVQSLWQPARHRTDTDETSRGVELRITSAIVIDVPKKKSDDVVIQNSSHQHGVPQPAAGHAQRSSQADRRSNVGATRRPLQPGKWSRGGADRPSVCEEKERRPRDQAPPQPALGTTTPQEEYDGRCEGE
nr:unnamed protein product [Digitaria exilis]